MRHCGTLIESFLVLLKRLYKPTFLPLYQLQASSAQQLQESPTTPGEPYNSRRALQLQESPKTIGEPHNSRRALQLQESPATPGEPCNSRRALQLQENPTTPGEPRNSRRALQLQEDGGSGLARAELTYCHAHSTLWIPGPRSLAGTDILGLLAGAPSCGALQTL